MKVKQPEEVTVIKIPIRTPNAVAWDMAIEDRVLTNAICEYSKELRKQGVEVFERKQNVIATEQGFYFAMYEQDRVAVDGGDYVPTE